VLEAVERGWKPIREKRGGARRMSGRLHLAQAQSNRERRGHKKDFLDAERLEQRLWRTVTRRKYQLTRLGAAAEPIGVSPTIRGPPQVVQPGASAPSARRMLKALAEGETSPAALAALADQKLRATPEQLCDALGACTELKPVYRRLLKMALEQLQFLEQQIDQLDQEMASLLNQHQEAVQRLAEVPSLGVDSVGTRDHCRSWPYCSELSLREMSLLVSRRLPG